MLKTLLITSLLTLFSSTAEAHDTCYLQTAWKPGYWHVAYRGTPYERSNWIDGYWIDKRVCPPPPPRRTTSVRVYVPRVFPHVNIITNRSRSQHRSHSHHRPHRSHRSHRSHGSRSSSPRPHNSHNHWGQNEESNGHRCPECIFQGIYC